MNNDVSGDCPLVGIIGTSKYCFVSPSRKQTLLKKERHLHSHPSQSMTLNTKQTEHWHGWTSYDYKGDSIAAMEKHKQNGRLMMQVYCFRTRRWWQLLCLWIHCWLWEVNYVHSSWIKWKTKTFFFQPSNFLKSFQWFIHLCSRMKGTFEWYLLPSMG